MGVSGPSLRIEGAWGVVAQDFFLSQKVGEGPYVEFEKGGASTFLIFEKGEQGLFVTPKTQKAARVPHIFRPLP